MTITQKDVDDAIELWIKRRLSLENISAYFLFVYLIFQLLSKIAFGSIRLLQASKCYFKILRSFSST